MACATEEVLSQDEKRLLDSYRSCGPKCREALLLNADAFALTTIFASAFPAPQRPQNVVRLRRQGRT